MGWGKACVKAACFAPRSGRALTQAAPRPCLVSGDVSPTHFTAGWPVIREEPVWGFRALLNPWKCPILTSSSVVIRCTLFIL